MAVSGTGDEFPRKDDGTARLTPFTQEDGSGIEASPVQHDEWPRQFRGRTFRIIDDTLYIIDPGPPYCPHGCRFNEDTAS